MRLRPRWATDTAFIATQKCTNGGNSSVCGLMNQELERREMCESPTSFHYATERLSLSLQDDWLPSESVENTVQIGGRGNVAVCTMEIAPRRIFASPLYVPAALSLQVVVPSDVPSYSEVDRLSTGASVAVKGVIVESPGKGQRFEIRAEEVSFASVRGCYVLLVSVGMMTSRNHLVAPRCRISDVHPDLLSSTRLSNHQMVDCVLIPPPAWQLNIRFRR